MVKKLWDWSQNLLPLPWHDDQGHALRGQLDHFGASSCWKILVDTRWLISLLVKPTSFEVLTITSTVTEEQSTMAGISHLTCLCGNVREPASILRSSSLPYENTMCHCNTCRCRSLPSLRRVTDPWRPPLRQHRLTRHVVSYIATGSE
jgi:hypothetical protein